MLLVLLAMTVVWALVPPTASAASAVVVRFGTIPSATIGAELQINASLRTNSGVRPAFVTAKLFMANVGVGTAHSDANGQLAFRVSKNYTKKAGTFPLRVETVKTHDFSAASAIATLTLRPAMITVVTVPIVRGIPVTLGGASGTTGDDGTVKLAAPAITQVPLAAHIDQLADPSIRVTFLRWSDSVYDQSRTFNVTGDAKVVLGLRTAFKGSVNFVDETGQTIDPTQISRARFTSSTGQELVLTDFSQ